MTELLIIKGAILLVAGFLIVMLIQEMATRMRRSPHAGAGNASVANSIATESLGPIDILVRRVLKFLLAAGAMGGVYLWVTTPTRERSPSPPSETAASTHALSRSQKLANIRIDALQWSKEGFGAVMIATFRIDNDNPVAIKDVAITCVHSTHSGTVIDRNTRTVYEIVNSNSYLYVRDFNMGFIRSQSAQSRCYVSDFVDR